MSKALLIILDGWGLSTTENGNAPLIAKTPTLDYIYATYPKTSIVASGLEVGLNPGESGNSEVGHLNLGSGRVVWENLPRINRSIENNEFLSLPAFLAAADHVKKHGSALHLWGLVSDGGVHSHIQHLTALLRLVSQAKIKNVYIHLISDGRDTAPQQTKVFIEQLEKNCREIGAGRIATIIGRYFAMDRDKNWDRIGKATDLIVQNEGAHFKNAAEAIDAAYAAGKTDEFIEPAAIGEGGKIQTNDAVIMFNFRADRSRQMFDVLSGNNKEPFARQMPAGLLVCTMTRYYKDQKTPVAFEEIDLTHTLAETISVRGLRQYHLAETEKYAHVTYFFNGGVEKPYPKEEQVIVPSKKVATYDKAPEMSAAEVGDKLVGAIKSNYDFIVVNFANGDMVGHTGVFEAAVLACEFVDRCLAELLAAASRNGYHTIITADHGNCETMINERTGEVNKEHTTNPVPFVNLNFQKIPFQLSKVNYSVDEYVQYAAGSPVGILADVSPSVLAILDLPQPKEMAGMDLTAVL